MVLNAVGLFSGSQVTDAHPVMKFCYHPRPVALRLAQHAVVFFELLERLFGLALEPELGTSLDGLVALPGRGEEALDFNPLSMEWFYSKGIALIAELGQGGTAAR